MLEGRTLEAVIRTAHPNEALFRQLLEGWGRGDRDAGHGSSPRTPSSVTPVAARSMVSIGAGTALLRFLANQDRYSASRFKPEFLDLVAGDRHVSCS
jgi:hypothetical protein